MDAWGPTDNPESVLTELVTQHQQALRRMCFFLLHDPEAARDAVQETFLKAYRSLNKWRGDCSAKSWLMRIALNTCRDMTRTGWFRHTDRRITPEELPLASSPMDEEALALTQAVGQLPRKLQEAVLLYYYQDMTLQEAADALRVAPSTVSKRLAQARNKLRALLERGSDDA